MSSASEEKKYECKRKQKLCMKFLVALQILFNSGNRLREPYTKDLNHNEF